MKKIISVATVIVAFGSVLSPARSEASPEATFLSAADISNVVKRSAPSASTDNPLRVLDAGGANVGFFVVHRPEEPDQGCTIEHDTLSNDKTTSILIVVEGAGTLVAGGRLLKPVPIDSGDPDSKLLGAGSRGSGIESGESRRLTVGDVVIIPAGVPHGFSAIEKSITYEVVRVDSGKMLPLR